MKNIILATCAADAAIPVKPNTPATIATIKNINTHINIVFSSKKVTMAYLMIDF